MLRAQVLMPLSPYLGLGAGAQLSYAGKGIPLIGNLHFSLVFGMLQ